MANALSDVARAVVSDELRRVIVTYDFEVSDEIPASPDEIYAAWMTSAGHSAMTGGEAHVGPEVGDDFDAWNGYIHGTTLELEPSRRIVQSWRSTQFTDDDEDSRIEVLLDGTDDATLVTVRHSNVPSDHRGYQDGGWQQSYFTPMKAYFDKE
jgi:activator of HSP90 ATPase